MTNYGIKFNEVDRDQRNLVVLTQPTPEQIKAKATLDFIRFRGHHVRATSPDKKAEQRRWADEQRQFLYNGIFPWERKKAGHIHDEPVAQYRWLDELLGEVSTPWYRRLWRWLDPRKQFRDWDRDEEAWEAKYPGRIFRDYTHAWELGTDGKWYIPGTVGWELHVPRAKRQRRRSTD